MIRLHSLSISRFRGIREGAIQGLTDVNLLIGRNNSGKTTVVEAILRSFLQGGGGQEVLGRSLQDIILPIRQENNPYAPQIWFRQDQAKVVVLEAKVGDSANPDRSEDFTVGQRVVAQPGNIQGPAIRIEVNGGIAWKQVEPFVKSVGLFRPLDGANRNVETQFWPQLLANRRDKALTRSLNSIFDLKAESFQLLPDNRLLVLFEDYSLPLDVQGDGTRAAVRCLMVLAMMKGGLMMMEEPECHQHPGSLERFAAVLCRAAREQEVQLLISTHSIECVAAFLKATHEIGSEGAVFHLSLTDGKQQARRLDAEAVETLQSTGIDVRFLDRNRSSSPLPETAGRRSSPFSGLFLSF